MKEHRCSFIKNEDTELEKRCTKRANWLIFIEDKQTQAQMPIWVCDLHKNISLQLVQLDEDIKILAVQELKEKVDFT